eukprot:4495826-Prymnesium_polylepis.1
MVGRAPPPSLTCGGARTPRLVDAAAIARPLSVSLFRAVANNSAGSTPLPRCVLPQSPDTVLSSTRTSCQRHRRAA